MLQVTELRWIEGERAVVQSSEDKTLRVWDLRSCCVAQQLKPKQHVQVIITVRVCATFVVYNVHVRACAIFNFLKHAHRRVVGYLRMEIIYWLAAVVHRT